jgi:hypothetical protein
VAAEEAGPADCELIPTTFSVAAALFPDTDPRLELTLDIAGEVDETPSVDETVDAWGLIKVATDDAVGEIELGATEEDEERIDSVVTDLVTLMGCALDGVETTAENDGEDEMNEDVTSAYQWESR